MKAIVLTYDKYSIFADHMISAYQELWPENPFTFRVPFQDQKIKSSYEQKYREKVQLIRSSEDIVETVETLLGDLGDDDWIFWCMDDRYPISLQTGEIEKIYHWIKTIDDRNTSAVMFLNSRKGQKPENLHYTNHTIYDSNKNKYRRRKNYTMIWMHQFMRVKVMRNLFSHFPKNLKSAKEMDYIMFKQQLPENQRLFVINKILAYLEKVLVVEKLL